ncbi:MAG: hypothetical protein Q9M40_00130 [Sulfurimonas sp.]|nr:hypothetical protein [Sulfurimonas sp.]
MLALNINNKEIKNFYKQESDRIKSSFIQGMKEIKEMQSGQRQEQDLKSFLDD